MRCYLSRYRKIVADVLLLLALPIGACADGAPVVPPRKGTSENIQLFDGKTLTGWEGHEQHWSVQDGEIVGKNTDAVPVSTYLLTKRNFSDFRLTCEFKLVESEMHSGIAFWGHKDPEKGDPYTYAGHLVMFPTNYGFYDLYGRNSIHKNADQAKKVGKQHDWNLIEIVAQGNRIRFALNGTLISDWSEPEPDRIQEGPLGLQLHSNKVPQEVRFRNLMLETFPEDRLVTVKDGNQTASGIRTLERSVPADSTGLWTNAVAAVLPDDLLQPMRRGQLGLTSVGIRESERDAYYAVVQKARELPLGILKQAATEWRGTRRQAPENKRYASKSAPEFPTFADLFQHPELYHGKLLSLRGHIRKLIEIPPEKNPYGIERLYEAWLFDEHAQSNPAIIVCTQIADGLEPATETLFSHCSATGYFFKNMAYEGQREMRFAPLLIAQKLEYTPPQIPKETVFQQALDVTTEKLGIDGRVVWMGGVGVVTIACVVYLWRRQRRVIAAVHARERSRAESTGPLSIDGVPDTGGPPDFNDIDSRSERPQ